MHISNCVCITLTFSLLAVVAGVTMVMTFGHVIDSQSMRSEDLFRQTICHVTSIRLVQYNETTTDSELDQFSTTKISFHGTNYTTQFGTSTTNSLCVSVEVNYHVKLNSFTYHSTENKTAILYSDVTNYMNRHVLKEVRYVLVSNTVFITIFFIQKAQHRI